MPSRHLTIAIVGFWLAMTGWLFYRDLWPRLRPGGPPPFTIDLADEASERTIRWTIYMDGQDRGYAQTRVAYQWTDDTFELSGTYRLWTGQRHSQPPNQTIESLYRVSREGQLLAMRAEVGISIVNMQIDASAAGQVVAGRLTPHVRVKLHGLSVDASPLLEHTLTPIEVPYRASVLDPRAPFNKVRGLAPGQRWQMPYFDPLTAISEQMMPGLRTGAGDRPFVDARVLSVRPLPNLPLRMGPSMPAFLRGGELCFVIEYHGEDMDARTWVRESDSVVLRQEVTKNGETITLQRD